MSVPFLFGKTAITVYVDGITYMVPASAPNFADLKAALRDNADEATVKKILNIRDYIASITEGRAEIVDGSLYFDGSPLSGALAVRVATMLTEGFGVLPLLRFLNRVAANPRMDKNSPLYSTSFQDELYLFLEKGECPITEDGKFLAYKMIRRDYTDIYTGTMDNSVGALVTLESPEDVDPERNNTCSRGLHFASLNYVLNGNYGSAERSHRLVVLEIDPADVISIPYDYDNSKGRAWKYTVLREIEWDERIKPNFISNDSVSNWDEPEDDDLEWEEDEEDVVDLTDSSECIATAFGGYETSQFAGNLEPDVVRAIRAANDGRNSKAAVARLYDVSARTVGRIWDGETYTWVK